MTAHPARRTFGPCVLVGLVSTGALAWTATKPWAEPVGDAEEARSTLDMVYATAGQVPVASAVSLLALACWGVLLVTRGVVRQVFAVVGTLCALGLVVVVVQGADASRDDVRRALASVSTQDQVGLTPWYWVAVGCVVPMLVTFCAAVRWAKAWPAMGDKYDRPTGKSDAEQALADADEDPLGLWRALDRGDDPTG